MLLRKKKKHADGIFLTWFPTFAFGPSQAAWHFKDRGTLKVCRRETPSAEVADFTFIQQTRSLAVRNADQLNLLLHPEAKASYREEWHRGESSGLCLHPAQVRTRSRRLASKTASVEPQLGYHSTSWKCEPKRPVPGAIPRHSQHQPSILRSIITESAAHQATAHVFFLPHTSDEELFTYSSHGWQAKSEGVGAQA